MSVIYRNSTAYGQTMAYGGFTPVGTVISIMGNSAPANYLKCDGTIYNISDYPDLANYFVAQFGAANKFGGDGTATFAVPDLRGEFLRGTGTNSHTITSQGATGPEGSGATVGTHQASTIVSQPVIYLDTAGTSAALGNFTSNDGKYRSVEYSDSALTPVSGTTMKGIWVKSADLEIKNTSTTGVQETVRPTNTSVLYCIAVKNIYIENGGGSSSNGHTIQDTDGNDMPNENNLQFIGLLVQDDSGNGATVVEAAGLNQESIDDVMSAGAAGNQVAGNGLVYSTTEQVVGRWVDGKPLYQKTITGITPAGGSETTKFVPIGAQVDMGFNVISVVTDQDGHWFTSFNRSITDASQIFRVNVFSNIESANPNTLRVDCSVTQWVNKPFWATIRYTKVTD